MTMMVWRNKSFSPKSMLGRGNDETPPSFFVELDFCSCLSTTSWC